MTNSDLAKHVFEFLRQAGVQNVVVCAGARNAPLVVALKNENFNDYSFFEERSAAFFALGLIKSEQKPVAILTTSGTAAAELLPAAIEATYQGLPLILITADRPDHYRGSGSPQTIDQIGLFKSYVEEEYDLDVNSTKFEFAWSGKKPIHLNVCFDEPLIDQPSMKETPVKFTKTVQKREGIVSNANGVKPLIILGEIDPSHKAKVVEFILQTRAPVFAESLSHLQNKTEIQPYLLRSSEHIIKSLFQNQLCDSVIRIGGVPTLRFWRDLEQTFQLVPVLNYSDVPFSGLARSSHVFEMSQLTSLVQFPVETLSFIKKTDARLQVEKERLLQQYPMSEPSLTLRLSEKVGEAPVYIGNSLPIRMWDQFAVHNSKSIAANRGANGIDGQVSTYLGWSENKSLSYAFIGDLTAMYDLAALGLTEQLHIQRRNIVIMNNFGGQIFKRVFKNDDFVNPHKTQFYHWAKMWNWSYLLITDVDGFNMLKSFNTPNLIVEIVPDATETENFWNDWDKACQKF